MEPSTCIKAIDSSSVHRITSGQVVIDLQTAVKELVENSLDAGATIIEVRFKEYGLKSFEVIDNGTGIAAADYDSIALKHHTSKLSTFEDLSNVLTFGFRGEALSSLCALSQDVTVTTACEGEAPMASVIQLDRNGRVKNKDGRVARQRGTTVTVTGLFAPLAVRRKEFERNAKREFGKALTLLTAYALVPCANENKGVRFSVSNQLDSGKKSVQIQADGTRSLRTCVTSLWGPKALDKVMALDLTFEVNAEKSLLKRQGIDSLTTAVKVRGLISSFTPGGGRIGTDRQFLFVNGRPFASSKIQKAINEVYRGFNTNQSPFVIADFQIPPRACDINVSPDKRTIFLHSEDNLIQALKCALEDTFSPSRSTFAVGTQQSVASAVPDSSEPEDEDELINDDEDETSSLLKLPTPNPAAILKNPSRTNSVSRLTSVPPINKPKHSAKPAPTAIDADSDVEILPESTTSVQVCNSDTISSDEVTPLFLPHSPQSSVEHETITLKPLPRPQHNSIRSPSRSPSIPAIKQVTAMKKPGQTVLSTLGTSWNLRRGAQEEGGGPRKKPRLEETKETPRSPSLTGDHARRNIRQKLKSFQSGSQTVVDIDEDDERQDVQMEDVASEYDDEVIHPLSEANSSPEVIDLTQALDNPLLEPKPQETVIEVRRDTQDEYTLRFDVGRVARTWVDYRTWCGDLNSTNSTSAAHAVTDETPSGSLPPVLHNVNQDSAAAERVLSMVVHKEDFDSMQVLGQFNLGFIIARRSKAADMGKDVADDLFIIDQHAADEKYNFETLQETTKIESQKLFRPRVLELSAADELLAIENIEVLRNNGFELAIHEEAPQKERVKLTAQPMSRDTVFDMKDLEELLHLMQDQPTGQMVRCSKARSMFASRACRKSIMIGKPLSHPQMTTVVRHMGQMEQPWNCPHGRPTMRHLISLEDRKPRPISSVDWQSFMVAADAGEL